jgi:hypothetical protein
LGGAEVSVRAPGLADLDPALWEAETDPDGRFAIADVPRGRVVLQVFADEIRPRSLEVEASDLGDIAVEKAPADDAAR